MSPATSSRPNVFDYDLGTDAPHRRPPTRVRNDSTPRIPITNKGTPPAGGHTSSMGPQSQPPTAGKQKGGNQGQAPSLESLPHHPDHLQHRLAFPGPVGQLPLPKVPLPTARESTSSSGFKPPASTESSNPVLAWGATVLAGFGNLMLESQPGGGAGGGGGRGSRPSTPPSHAAPGSAPPRNETSTGSSGRHHDRTGGESNNASASPPERRGPRYMGLNVKGSLVRRADFVGDWDRRKYKLLLRRLRGSSK